MPELPRRQVLLAATAALVTVAGTGAALATPPSHAVATTVLAGDLLPGLDRLTPLHPTAASTPVQVDVVIARPDPAGELAAYRAMYTPGSSTYHHFFTPAAFAARFGVPQATYDAARSWATRDGMTVVRSSAARDVLVLRGTATQVERTFSVHLLDYRSDGTSFFANTTAPRVPDGLGIRAVVGLNSKLRMHTFHDRPAARSPHGRTPAQDTCTGGSCIGLTTPQDLWSVYDQPSDNLGEGQTMAIFGEGQTDPVIGNLRSFEKLHHLAQVPITVVHADGPGDYSDNSGEIEWDLDTQASTGMAPNVQGETLYFGKDLSDASVLSVFNTWASDPNGPLQASASYGECEENPAGDAAGAAYAYSAGAQFTEASEVALRQAAMEGRTLFASTGDTGSTCPVVPVNLNGVAYEVPGVNYPASSPYVVAVGGTVLYASDTSDGSQAQRQLEYAWTYTGGGTSVTFTRPDYQADTPQVVGICLAGPGSDPSAAGQPCRGVPDVAAQSGDIVSNGYGIVAQGTTNFPGGGTSLSSPLTLGMWTRIQAAAPPATCPAPGHSAGKGDGNAGGKGHGKGKGRGRTACTATTTTYPGNGFADESYYRHPGDFFDVGGGPQSPPTANGSFASTPGWDYLSGLGTPDVTKLATDIDHATAPANPLPAPCPYGATGCSSTGGTGGTGTGGIKPCGSPLFTDPTGDDAYVGDPNGSGSNPQLDIVSGDLSDDGTTLQATLTIADLSTDMASAAGGANEYYLLWTYKGTQYFANAEVDSVTGTITYSDGTFDATTGYSTAHTDTGSFDPGKDGTVTVDVPLKNVGAPPAGTDLTAPAGQTSVLVGSSATGGLVYTADTGGPRYDYQVGTTC